MRHRIVDEMTLNEIKSSVVTRLSKIGELEDETAAKESDAVLKKKKFLNFILNLSSKKALRRWKEQVFGIGGDPRLGVLLIDERERVR